MPKAIDVHVHAPYEQSLFSASAGSPLAQVAEAAQAYFRSGPVPKNVEEMAVRYRRVNLRGRT